MKQQAKNVSPWKLGTLAALCALLFTVFACSEDVEREVKTNKDNSIQEIIIQEEVQSKDKKLKVDANYANGEWSGTVYNAEGKGLPGINILVAGTRIGTVSDMNGTFRLKADGSKDLDLSFIGYESVTLKGK